MAKKKTKKKTAPPAGNAGAANKDQSAATTQQGDDGSASQDKQTDETKVAQSADGDPGNDKPKKPARKKAKPAANGDPGNDKPQKPALPQLPEGAFYLQIKQSAVLGNGTRKKGEVLGTCHCAEGITVAEVLDTIRDPRWSQEVEGPDGSCEVVIKRPRPNRRVGQLLFTVRPHPGYTVRECINALRNPHIIGR